MAYKALKANGLSFELIRAEDIKKGHLKNYAMLFVPGGWASNKLKPLGNAGIAEIKKFVRNGGNYLGFCGGAGLAMLEGIGLLNIKRMPTKDRIPSFSGRIYLTTTKHPIWDNCKIQDAGYKIQDNHASCIMHHASENSSLIFHAWWPSQFLTPPIPSLTKGGNRGGKKILATYGNALPDSFSSDLNVGDVEMNSNWTELEEIYGINLNPKRLKNEPAVIEGTFGKGRVILSLIHFDTPDDANGTVVLRNLWEYLGGNVVSDDVIPAEAGIQSAFLDSRFHGDDSVKTFMINSPLISEVETIIEDLVSLGIRNFLWFWRNPMLLQWRRGVRGLEYCTLYIMIKEIAEIIKTVHSSQFTVHGERKTVNGELINSLPITDYLLRIKELLIPFVDKAKHLLILERYALQNGHITYERCDDPAIQKIRIELFGDSKSHGGLFKNLIDETDKLLYALIKMEAEGQRKHCPSSHS